MPARLQAWLQGERVLPQAALQAAAARQLIYGGTLDTAILELGAMTEAAIWTRLAEATGLPVPASSLCDGSAARTAPVLPADRTRSLRAVPVTVEAGTLDLLCSEPVAADEIRAVAAESGFQARLYVVPEVRLFAVRQRVYGETLPARYAPLLARIVGAGRARRMCSRGTDVGAVPTPRSSPPPPAPTPRLTPPPPSRVPGEAVPGGNDTSTPREVFLDFSGPSPTDSPLEVEVEIEAATRTTGAVTHRPSGSVRLEVVSTEALSAEPPPSPPSSPIAPIPGPEGLLDGPHDPGADAPTEALCRRARDAEDKGRSLALRALRRRLTHPAVQILLGELRQTADPAADGDPIRAIQAMDALGELRDDGVIPTLIKLLGDRKRRPEVADAAQRTLVVLCAQDFGRSPRRWQDWVTANNQKPRVQWLLDGLGHKQPAIRMAAFEELRQLSGDSFGYLFDLPKRKREAARRRWISWWEATREHPRDISGDGSFLGAAEPAVPHAPNTAASGEHIPSPTPNTGVTGEHLPPPAPNTSLTGEPPLPPAPNTGVMGEPPLPPAPKAR